MLAILVIVAVVAAVVLICSKDLRAEAKAVVEKVKSKLKP